MPGCVPGMVGAAAARPLGPGLPYAHSLRTCAGLPFRAATPLAPRPRVRDPPRPLCRSLPRSPRGGGFPGSPARVVLGSLLLRLETCSARTCAFPPPLPLVSLPRARRAFVPTPSGMGRSVTRPRARGLGMVLVGPVDFSQPSFGPRPTPLLSIMPRRPARTWDGVSSLGRFRGRAPACFLDGAPFPGCARAPSRSCAAARAWGDLLGPADRTLCGALPVGVSCSEVARPYVRFSVPRRPSVRSLAPVSRARRCSAVGGPMTTPPSCAPGPQGSTRGGWASGATRPRPCRRVSGLGFATSGGLPA